MCSSDRPSISTVPLATLVCATKPPAGSIKDVILSPEGRKRYFVVHGGLFSKDDVTNLHKTAKTSLGSKM